jgi:hypothetical protein
MANMNTALSTPFGRWWHPLPLASGISITIAFIVMKLGGALPNMSWLMTILIPLASDFALNFALSMIWCLSVWIECEIEKRKMKSKQKPEV